MPPIPLHARSVLIWPRSVWLGPSRCCGCAVGGVTLATLLLGALIWLLSSAGGGAIAPGGLDAMPLGAALLIAACLGSTDAGATISVLASVRQLVPERLQHLLEFESSVNDPTALLLFGLVAGLFTTGPADGAAMAAVPSAAHTIPP